MTKAAVALKSMPFPQVGNVTAVPPPAMPLPLRSVAALAALAAFAALPLAARAADDKFPSRPIEITATFGPGGGTDLMARKMAQILEKRLGVPLPVNNVAGASGNAGLAKVLSSPADGYTIGTMIALTVSAWASGVGNLKSADFTVLAIVQDSPSMLFVPADSPHQTFQQFLDYAKANPGKMKVATSGYGTQDDITIRYLASLGFKTVNVPFANPSERYASPLSKGTDAIYEEPGDVAQFVDSKQYRTLVVFDDNRHPQFPDVPCSKEFSMKISDLPNFRSLSVSAKTPPEIVKVLSEAVKAAMDDPEWVDFAKKTYTYTAWTPNDQANKKVQDFYATVKGYLQRFKEDKK